MKIVNQTARSSVSPTIMMKLPFIPI